MKIIINVNDGKNIGRISDLEIDDTGKIINFYCLQKRTLFNFFMSNKEINFTINDIKKIGEDVILVELD